MCLNYQKHVPYTWDAADNAFFGACPSTYRRTTDISCVGISTLDASRILWMMDNAAAWGLDVNTEQGRIGLNAQIWHITNPTTFPCSTSNMCVAATAAVTTPYTNIECRLTFLCPDESAVQPFVLYSGLTGGTPVSAGGIVSPNQTICLGQNNGV
jgi:hypothetical protein